MIAVFITSVLTIGIFVVLFVRSRLVPTARRAMQTAQGAIEVMRDPALDDDAREKAVQSSALALSGTTGILILRVALLLGGTALPVIAADLAGLANWQDTLAFLSRWDVILGATVVVGGLALGLQKWRP